MKLRAFGNLIIVKRQPMKTHSDAGLIIPEDAREMRNFGKVLSVGDKIDHVEEGDDVVFIKAFQLPQDWDNMEMITFVNSEDVLAVIKKEDQDEESPIVQLTDAVIVGNSYRR